MTTAKQVLRWITDWRNGLMVVASVFVALLAFIVIDSAHARTDALHAQSQALEARSATAKAASRRIDLLQKRIADLEAQGVYRSAEIGEMRAEVAALQRQVEQQGGTPIVPRTTTTTTPRPTTTTTRPRSTTTTTRPCSVSVPGVCLP